MNKRVNPRLIVFAAGALLAAAFCMTAFSEGIDAAFWIALVLLAGFVSLGLYSANSPKAKAVFLTAILASIIVSGGAMAIRVAGRVQVPVSSDASVLCVVTEAPSELGGAGVYTVNRLLIDGKSFAGGAELIVANPDLSFESFSLGAGVKLTHARIEAADSADASIYTSGISMRITVDCENCLIETDYRGTFFERIRYTVTNALRAHAPDSAGIAAALLFGDKSGLGSGEYDAFRLAGLAHALAVSGLHVGFLISILNFVTAKLKRFRIACFCFTGLILISYAAVCGGAVSVVRAVIMGILSGFAGAIGRRSDPLNNLALAAILILCVNPWFVRNLSFIMSFLSVLGIVLAILPLTKLFAAARLPAKLAASLAVTTAATLGILPVTAAYFHTVNLWSLLVNLVALPYIMVSFVALFFAALFALAGIAVLLAIPDLLLRGLRFLTEFFAGLPGSDFLLFGFGGAAIPYYAALVLLSGLVLFRAKRIRKLACTMSFVILIVTVLGVNLPKRYSDVQIGAVGRYGAIVSVSVFDGKCSVVGMIDETTYAPLDDFLAENRVRTVDLLVVAGYERKNREYVERVITRYRVGTAVYDYAENNAYFDAGVRCDRIIVDGTVEVNGFLLESASDSPNVVLKRGAASILTQIDNKPYGRFVEFIASVYPTAAEFYYRNVVTRRTARLPERAFAAGTRFVEFAF